MKRSAPIQLFRTTEEARKSCERLDTSTSIRVSEYKDIIGVCELAKDDFAKCQLVDEDGHKCPQRFGRGFVMQRADDIECFVGRDCARDHFGLEHEHFHAATSRADADVAITKLVDRLQKLLERREKVLDQVQTAKAALRATWSRMRDVRKRLDAVTSALDRMTRSGRVVSLEFEYRELREDSEGNLKEVSVWKIEPVGSIAHAGALDESVPRKLINRLSKSSKAATDAIVSREQDLHEMRSWSAALEDVVHCSREIAELTKGLDSFLAPDNVRLLWLLAREGPEQVKTVRAALSLVNVRKGISWATATDTLRAWRAAYEEARGAVGSRVPR